LIALTVAAAIITATLSLYGGLEDKLNREFRSYGANATVAAPTGQTLPENGVAQARNVLSRGSLVVPFAFAVAHTANGDAVVVAGTDMQQVQRLNRWWLVTAWPKEKDEALVGSNAASHLQLGSGAFALQFGSKPLTLRAAGTLKTGAGEDDRVYIPLSTFESWTGIGPSLLEIYVPGSAHNVNAAIQRLQTALPGMEVKPVRQLLAAEGAVVRKMKSVMLASTLLITITVALCVFATLTSSVLERRRDFAVMKAIGSSQWTVNALFAGEALALGLFAALAGYVCGGGLAAWIAQANFHTALWPTLSLLPIVIACSLALALIASILPLAQLQRIEPAGILKGE
jgi:putative ABC transport system permease protein